MAADTAQVQNHNLAPLITEDLPTPAQNQEPEILSPPPAYYPPQTDYLPSLANNPFVDTNTNANPFLPPNLQPQNEEQALLQQQYTEYFTQLFTKWIDYALLFYKYGFPLIKWSSFFLIKGCGGWKESFLLAGWGLIWVAPGLYWGILGKQINDVKRFGNLTEKEKRMDLGWWIYQVVFWGTWALLVGVKFVLLWVIVGIERWWLMWPLWMVWVWLFDWQGGSLK